jgi:hypothetical protein
MVLRILVLVVSMVVRDNSANARIPEGVGPVRTEFASIDNELNDESEEANHD